MLIAVIAVQSYASAQQHIQAALSQADGIELRLDYLSDLDMSAIAMLCAKCSLPIIMTLRSKAQGGFYPNDELQRYQDLLSLCALQPDYLDLEYDTPSHIVQRIHDTYPEIKLMCSYHDFQKTPLDLAELLHTMQGPCFYAYKIATYAQTTLDALRMLVFVKNTAIHQKISGLCMGDEGVCTRIVGHIFGGMMTYACLEAGQEIASGQLTLTQLLTTYRYRTLNAVTQIYALLGDPIDLSVGHILHNQAMGYLQKNAIYIKLRLSQDQFCSAWVLCEALRISGMSVTMPLKETVGLVLNRITGDALHIGAVNTVIRDKQHYIGMNTDGIGAMQALMSHTDITHKTIVVLGAGGAARAIVYAAKQLQAHVIILNRTLENAQRMAEEFGAEAYALSQLEAIRARYDIIINTLPNSVFLEADAHSFFHENVLRPHSIAMDIIYQPLYTAFLQRAKQAHCHCIFGYEMYTYQALCQLDQWFSLDASQKAFLKEHMLRYFVE
ncbi:MAG: shikimate dehydrogenase [Legionella sp.]|nr:MAG: shikimate dehydrogenase [Legionella sp.]